MLAFSNAAGLCLPAECEQCVCDNGAKEEQPLQRGQPGPENSREEDMVMGVGRMAEYM